MTQPAGIGSSLDRGLASPRRPGFLGQRLSRWWPKDALRQRVIARVHRQRGAPTLPYTLQYRNVYILPTTFGTAFALLLVLTGLGGLNFNNNLALLLVFVLGAITQMTNMLAYRNLVGLEIRTVRGEPVFAGDPLHVQLTVRNDQDRHRISLEAALASEDEGTCRDVAARGERTFSLAMPTTRRGWQDIPPLRLQTRYPLGMFRAWTWVLPARQALVYPRPAKQPPPLPSSDDGQSGQARKGPGDQVYGLRNYRPGDPLKTIAWRTSARHDELYTRQMEVPQEATCVLDYRRLDGMDTEQRLSVLTAWVLLAEHRQLSYALRLPDQTLPTGSGPAHRADCLEALALFGS